MRNEEQYVAETLHSILDQDYPSRSFEVLVVDGRSTDGSREIVAQLARRHPAVNVTLLDNPGLLAAAGRNVGIRAARGRFIAIVDCHSTVGPDYLRTAERMLEETGADCLGRPVELFIATDTYLQRVIGAARTSWLGHNTTSVAFSDISGPASPLSHGIIYRREVFARIGFFNEHFDACEDVEFNSRLEQAGMKTWTVPALRASYHPRGSLWGLFKQMGRYAYWRYRLLREQRKAFHLTQAAPAIAVAVGIASVAGVPLGTPIHIPLALLAAYIAVILIASLRASATRGFRYLPALPLAYIAIHFGAGVGFWSGVLEGIGQGLARARGALGRKLRVATSRPDS
jgi:succinoglycan biosynthesis protein ExoA